MNNIKRMICTMLACSFVFGISCSQKTENTSKSVSDSSAVEVVHWEADREMFYEYEGLENAAEIIVIGTFVGEPETECSYSDELGGILVGVNTSCDIRIDKVIKGDVNVGDKLNVGQDSGIDPKSKNLVTHSELTPIKVGDQWIFFLRYIETYENYWYAGDTCGRYPIMEKSVCESLYKKSEDAQSIYNDAIEKLSTDELGVFESECFKKDLYFDVLTNLDCTL